MKKEISRKDIESLGRLDLIARQVVQGFITGLHKSPFHGFSVEFAEHRLYNQGEATRHIDWKLFARSDKLFVKQYEEETNLRCRFLLDTSASMFYPTETTAFSKIEFAVYAAAAFTEMLKKQRDAFGLSFFSKELYYHSEVKSTGSHQNFLFNQLESILNSPSVESTDIPQALHRIAEEYHKRSMIFIFSDMLQNISDPTPLIDALQHLRHNNHEVILFHILDFKTEIHLDFGRQPVAFRDLETGNEIRTMPEQIKMAYRERMDTFVKELRVKCGNLKIDYVLADAAGGFQKILLSYLLKRQKMM